MKVLHISRTPVAGVPYIVRDLMNIYMHDVEAKTLAPPCKYGDGRRWPHEPDANYRKAGAGQALIKWADVLVLHNGTPPPGGHQGKAMLCYYQSEPWNVNRTMEQAGAPAYTLAQYHATLYKLPIIPNLVDIHRDIFKPRSNRPDPAKRVVIGYSPSTRRDKTGVNLWNTKGYKPTMAALKTLSGFADIRVIEGKPWRECMEQRGDCHIVIDEVVTGSYHRCTLEASSQGQVVINGLSQAVRDVVAQVTGTQEVPWVVTSAGKLAHVLQKLVEEPKKLTEMGARTRQWMLEHWEPKSLLERFWLPALQSARSIGRVAQKSGRKNVIMHHGMPQVQRQPQPHAKIHKNAVLKQRAKKRMRLPSHGPAQLVKGPNIHPASELRGALKGRPCIIFGNSWSLNLMDLSKMRHFATIGCNRILRLFPPDYYIVVDRDPYRQDVELIKEFKGTRVLSSTIYDERIICRRVPLQPLPSFEFHTFRAATMTRRQLIGHRSFIESDWDMPVPSASNISWPLFQLAVMLGANPIGIAGIDLTWRNKKESHFFGEGSKEGAFEVSTTFLQRVFQQGAKLCHDRGVKVFNLSPEGVLNAFERITEVEFHRRFAEYADGDSVCPRELLDLESDPAKASVFGSLNHRDKPGASVVPPTRNGNYFRQGRAHGGASSDSARKAASASLQKARRRMESPHRTKTR